LIKIFLDMEFDHFSTRSCVKGALRKYFMLDSFKRSKNVI